jgi:hypothetical protein
LGIVITLSGAAMAQTVDTSGSGSAATNSSITKNGSTVVLASGTQVAAELQKSLNVENARIGDEVVLKTTSSIKQNGEVVIQKGSQLIGRVTEVQKKAKGEAGSKIGILFDTLKQDNMSMPISASIISVTSVASRAAVGDSLFADSSAGSSTSTRASGRSSGGGLLGGVGSTVGGVANTATSTVGGVANTATSTVGGVTDTAGSTVGSTTRSVGGTIRGLSISQSANATASGGSTLSLTSGNLKLDKGTSFNLAVSETASVKNSEMADQDN